MAGSKKVVYLLYLQSARPKLLYKAAHPKSVRSKLYTTADYYTKKLARRRRGGGGSAKTNLILWVGAIDFFEKCLGLVG